LIVYLLKASGHNKLQFSLTENGIETMGANFCQILVFSAIKRTDQIHCVEVFGSVFEKRLHCLKPTGEVMGY